MIHEEPTQPIAHKPIAKPQKQKKPPNNRRGCGCFLRTLIGGIVLVSLMTLCGVVGAGTWVYAEFSREIEDGIAKLETADSRETFETTQIFDRNGELLWEIFGEGKRTTVPITQIPEHLIQATVAVEDDTFYENEGYDLAALIAAIIANTRNPNERPVGASTITQQIVRHIAFDYEERTAVSYSRKTKELVLAWIMTEQFTKDEIMALYLNEIYYGNLAYGIEAAAQTYFGKSAVDLTLAEATMLASLPQSPVELDPLTNFEGAKERQWIVLNLMVSEGFITELERDTTYREPLAFVPQEVSLQAPHFSVYVRQQLEEQFGTEVVANGGLRVTTTLDLDYQKLAEQLARQHVTAVSPEHNLTNASLVALKPGTGEILAMLGSVDYKDESIDGHVNVALSLQQPGSSIKPLTFAAALSPIDGGDPDWTLGDVLWDVEVDYPQFNGQTYSPVNYDERFHGPVRLRSALANSYNIPAVLLLQDIGIQRYLEFGQQMGLTTWQNDASNYGLSLTLGGAEVTPLEMAGAYAVFANEGQRVPPISILRVEKSNGELLYEAPTAQGAQVLDPRVAYLISDVLDDDAARVPAMGRDNPLALPFPAAAKTGTTNDFRDNWTIGYTPGLVVAVWTGNTDNSEMINISGLTGAAPLWNSYMQAVYANNDLLSVLNENGSTPPPLEFAQPQGLEQWPLCAISSITIGAVECTSGGSELFLTLSSVPEQTLPEQLVWEEVDTAVFRLPAVALPPLPPELININDDGEDKLPDPLFCHFLEGMDVNLLPPEAAPQLFLEGPRNEESWKGALEWAAANNTAVLPKNPCTDELLANASGPKAAVYRITEPKANETVSGVIPIMGTASFDPQVVQFYKLELGIPEGDNNISWVTLGNTHNTPVVNGQLEMLHADALPAGSYFLRLIVIQDSNYVGEPHTITFSVD